MMGCHGGHVGEVVSSPAGAAAEGHVARSSAALPRVSTRHAELHRARPSGIRAARGLFEHGMAHRRASPRGLAFSPTAPWATHHLFCGEVLADTALTSAWLDVHPESEVVTESSMPAWPSCRSPRVNATHC